MAQTSPPAALSAFYDGWADHQKRLLASLSPLTDEQMKLRPGPDRWAVWQLASNMAGARAHWVHDILGEGHVAVRDMFRVASTTVPDLPLEDAGWEDDENHPRSAAELVDAFERTWRMIDDWLRRWTAEDLQVECSRLRRGQAQTFTRGWIIWHLMEHELQHGTEIAIILRDHGLPTLDI
ncbi:MAG: DinB family protein [Chloroflexi bacterium]|nr:DinB family protein [Chloroflexota bacterium]